MTRTELGVPRAWIFLAASLALAAVMAFGVATYRVTPPHEQQTIPWGMMVVGYVFLAIMSGGIADSAVLRVYLKGKAVDVKTFRRSLYTALAVLIPGIILVFSDILHPSRSYWFYLGFNPKSRIAWNAILYVVYGVLLALLLVALIRGRDPREPLVKALAAAMFVSSINLEMNLGMAFGSNIAVPVWYGVYSGMLFVTAAFALGAAWELATSRARLAGILEAGEAAERDKDYAVELIAAVLAVGFIVLWGVLGLYSWGLASSYVHELTAGRLAPFFWLGYVLPALVAPLALLPSHLQGRLGPWAARLTALLVILGLAVLIAVPYSYGGQAHRLQALETYAALSSALGYEESVLAYLLSPETAAFLGAFGLALILDYAGAKLLPLAPGERPRRLLIFK